MVVLITRPSPDGEALCDLLASRGITTLFQPLIEFVEGEIGDSLLSKLKRSDFVIAVSKPAVDWTDRALQSSMQTWPTTATYLAVGQKTADKLSEVTEQKVHYPSISDSEHLLQLPLLLSPKQAKITILRGNGGRELIRDELTERGASVEYCEVYQRLSLPFDGGSSINHWQENHVTHVVVTSGEQLTLLFDGIRQQNECSWLLQQKLIVPSRRIAQLAYKYGFDNVTVSGSASNPDLAAVIQQQCTTG